MSQAMEFAELSPQARRVVEAALTCIGRVGLAKTTLDDVAREAGCARATVYRCFANKLQLLVAVVHCEAERLRCEIEAATLLEVTLAGAATSAIVTSARFLTSHPALTFVADHEPDLIVPYLAFEREDAVLRTAAALVAPAFDRFLTEPDATRLGEWLARVTLSYLFSPSEHLDVTDRAHVRALVEGFVVPGFVNAEGAKR